jgi:hypothetical protein
MYTSMDIVSDDFCGGSSGGGLSNDPMDYVGDQDPGAGFGPDRMWLSYDEMMGEWVVSGAWSERVSSITAIVDGADMAYMSHPVGSMWMSTGSDNWAGPTAMYAWNDSMAWLDSVMSESPLPAGEGELFRFQYMGSGVPCLRRYVTTAVTWETGLFSDESYMNLPVTSRNWCNGADTATVSSVRIVPGPMGTGDWVVVANMTEPFVSLDVWFGADEDVIFGGAGDDVDTANWDVYGQVRQWDESNEQWYGATASVYGNNGDSTFAAGEDLEMFVVMSGDNSVNDKPCIEVGYTGAWSEGGMGQIPFVSDDFCHPARSASEFVGD